MNDVIIKRRPMIDLDEFERRLGRPCSTDQKDDDPLAELRRIIGDKNEPHKTNFEPKTQLPAMARPDLGETGEGKQPDAQAHLVGGNFTTIEAELLGTKQPDAVTLRDAERSTIENKRPKPRVPLLSGDFAVIEAGLLGALREQTTTTVSEANIPNAFPTVDLGSEGRLYQHDQPASRHTGVARGQIKSRRAPYVMGAILLIGMAGIAVSFGLNSRLSGQSDIASTKADNGPDNPQTDAMSSADVPAQDAANLSTPFDLPQAEEKSLPTASHTELDGPPAAPVMTPAQVQNPAEPLSTPVASIDTAPDGAPLSALQSPAAAKAPTPKAAGHVAKPLKPAVARHSDSHGQRRQIANKAKATPVNPHNSEPAPIGVPNAETPTTPPNPATNSGPLGLVQSAVNSLTSTTAKLFEWGRN